MVQKSFMVSPYLAEQGQYLPLLEDNRFRYGGVFVFFAGVWLDSSSLFLVSSLLRLKMDLGHRSISPPPPSFYRLSL